MTATEALDSDYENGVADVLAYLAGPSAKVERNVSLPGRLSGVNRQIDVLVRGKIYDRPDSTLVVDAKRWKAPLDVADVGCFIDLVRDVESDFGLLVTNAGASPGASTRAHREGTVQVDLLPVRQLLSWRPTGTFQMAYGLRPDEFIPAARALRRAGFRVTESSQWTPSDDSVAIEVFRHFGSAQPAADVQAETMRSVDAILAKHGIRGTLIAHGLIVGGGTPADRWLELTLSGEPTNLKILAATEARAEEILDQVAKAQSLPRDQLGYVRPSRWPGATLFPSWGVGGHRPL